MRVDSTTDFVSPDSPDRRKRQTAVLRRATNGGNQVASGCGAGGDRGGAQRAKLTETEKLLRDIETLRESIGLNWLDPGVLPMNADERIIVRHEIETLSAYLKNLLERLGASDT